MAHAVDRIVESLSEHHLEQLHRLYDGEWWTRGRTPEDVRRAVAGSDLVIGICEAPDDRLVAFARVLTDDVFKALVFDVIVSPDARGRGRGRRLLEQVVDHPRLRQVEHIELYCLPELVPFYKQWGFSTDVSGVRLMRRRVPRDPDARSGRSSHE
jgi:GNAT superfamily N-acetyltransferase